MSLATLACPFCHQLVAGTGDPGRRLTCPHCGETFAPRASDTIQADVQSPSTPATPTPEIDRFLGSPGARAGNRRLALLVLGGMVVMAVAGLVLALWTQPWRRANDTGLPGQPKNAQVGTEAVPLAAAQMPLLAHVPDSTNLLLGVHNADLRADPVGRVLLRKEFRVVGRTVPLDLTSWLQLDADEIEYTLITSTLPQNPLLPFDFRLAILVRTRRPVNEEEVVQRLGATRGTVKDTWIFQNKALKWDLALRFVNRRTLALGAFAEHLTPIPSDSKPGLDHLSAGLREVLPRIEPGGSMWLATDLDKPTREFLLGQLSGLTRGNPTHFETVQRLGAWLRPDNPMLLSAALCCADHKGAEQVRDYLAGLDPELREPQLKFALDDRWLSVQRRVDLDTLDRWLSRRGP